MYNSHDKSTILLSMGTINNGNRTEWSPFRSVIIDLITNRIRRQEVLLPINHSHFLISEQTNTPRTNISSGNNVLS